jgi:fido (protein-threonine AMPylation protein)
MDVLERDVLSKSPLLVSEDDGEVFGYVAEVMCELLALHPFREGNGRTAFIVWQPAALAE